MAQGSRACGRSTTWTSSCSLLHTGASLANSFLCGVTAESNISQWRTQLQPRPLSCQGRSEQGCPSQVQPSLTRTCMVRTTRSRDMRGPLELRGKTTWRMRGRERWQSKISCLPACLSLFTCRSPLHTDAGLLICSRKQYTASRETLSQVPVEEDRSQVRYTASEGFLSAMPVMSAAYECWDDSICCRSDCCTPAATVLRDMQRLGHELKHPALCCRVQTRTRAVSRIARISTSNVSGLR